MSGDSPIFRVSPDAIVVGILARRAGAHRLSSHILGLPIGSDDIGDVLDWLDETGRPYHWVSFPGVSFFHFPHEADALAFVLRFG
jgi:hypothetical protein